MHPVVGSNPTLSAFHDRPFSHKIQFPMYLGNAKCQNDSDHLWRTWSTVNVSVTTSNDPKKLIAEDGSFNFPHQTRSCIKCGAKQKKEL